MEETARKAGMRVLVMRGGALGDFILTLPLLRCVRKNFSRARLEILGYPLIAQIAVEAGLADGAHRLDAAQFAPLFSASPRAGHGGTRLPDSLAAWLQGFQVIVVVWRDPDKHLARALSEYAGGEVVHVEPIPSNEGRQVHSANHMVDQLPGSWRARKPASLRKEKLWIRAERRAWAKGYLRDALNVRGRQDRQGAPVALHPGSGGRGPNRNWPPERFAALAETLLAEGRDCLLIRGPADDGPVAAVGRLLNRNVPVASGLKPVELGAVLGEVSSYVGNDSGVTHLAAAVGTRTVAIFGASDSAVWGPLGEDVIILRPPPAHAGRKPEAGDIADISVADVLKALSRHL